MKRICRIWLLSLLSLIILWSGTAYLQNAESHLFDVPGSSHHPLKPLVDIVPPLGIVHFYGPIESRETSAPTKVFKDFFRTRSSYAFLRALYSPTHAQVGLVTLNLNISTQTCTQLLTGTTTTKIWIYNGLLSFSTNGTGQQIQFQPGLTNGTGSTCGTGAQTNFSTSALGTIIVQNTGTSTTSNTFVTINQGSPAILITQSSALDVTTATAAPVSGWLTVAQQ